MKLFPMVILAGGLATRLRPVTEKIPKALIEINGEPFISHQLKLLSSKGVREVVLSVGYLGEMIEDYIGNGQQYGLNITYSYDGPVLLGTGGAIRQALPLLGEKFFVLYGDSYLNCDYAAVQGAFEASNKIGMMTVYKNINEWDTSNIVYEDGKILVYDKVNRNADMHYIDYGLGVLKKNAFEDFDKQINLDLSQVYQVLLAGEELAAYEIHETFYEVGTVNGIKRLENHLLSLEEVP